MGPARRGQVWLSRVTCITYDLSDALLKERRKSPKPPNPRPKTSDLSVLELMGEFPSAVPAGNSSDFFGQLSMPCASFGNFGDCTPAARLEECRGTPVAGQSHPRPIARCGADPWGGRRAWRRPSPAWCPALPIGGRARLFLVPPASVCRCLWQVDVVVVHPGRRGVDGDCFSWDGWAWVSVVGDGLGKGMSGRGVVLVSTLCSWPSGHVCLCRSLSAMTNLLRGFGGSRGGC